MSPQEIRNRYTEIRNENEILLSVLKRRQLMISFLRLLVFLGGGVLTAFIFTYSSLWGSISLLVIIISFIFLLKRYEDYSEEITITQNLIRINSDEIKALEGDYSAFDGATDLNDATHDFSNDIDLFGDDSLFSYLNRTVTGSGRTQLARWLCEPYEISGELVQRQEAVRELSDRLVWRQRFMAYGLDKDLNDKELRSLNEWLEEDDIFRSSRTISIVATLFPALAIAALVLVIAGTVPFAVFLLSFLINLFVISIFLRRINRIHAMVSKKHLFLSSVAQLLRSFENEKFNSSILGSIREKLCMGQSSVASRIKKLDAILRWFDTRLNMIMGFLLNGILLWDIHCIIKLEKWRRTAASCLPEWLTLLGTIDGLNSLANYAYNYPDHAYPVIADDGTVLEATGMGHPLLGRDIRVSNNFSIPKRGLVFIITGANMAGKSTFLRTVAVNMVLAMAGAPACCARMKFSPMRLFTSMRTVDSLSHNESYFYAELKRLRILKERIERKEDILFVLDEILKGTNSTDKSFGSKHFLRLMIGTGGTGLVATHDISLGEMESEFPGVVMNRCFEIEIDNEKISFDYRLREGITRKMNAMILMKQMGIV